MQIEFSGTLQSRVNLLQSRPIIVTPQLHQRIHCAQIRGAVIPEPERSRELGIGEAQLQIKTLTLERLGYHALETGIQRAARDLQSNRIRLSGVDELRQRIQPTLDVEGPILKLTIPLNTKRTAVVDVIDHQ